MNEFIARNGIIARSNSTISGSFFVSGSVGLGSPGNTGSLDVRGTTVVGVNSGGSLLGIGVNLAPTISASGNFNTLIGLRIVPNFVTGSFTSTAFSVITSPGFSVNENGWVLTPRIIATGDTFINTLDFQLSAGMLVRNSSVVNVGYWFANGHLRLGNEASFVDNGYRLQVNSSGSASGSLYITGSVSQTLLRIDSPASSSILFVTGSARVGILNSNPSFTLDVSGSTFSRKLIVGSDAAFTGAITQSDYFQRSTTSGTVFIVRDVNNNTIFAAAGASGTSLFYSQAQNIGLGTSAPTAKVQVTGNGTTSTTTAFLIQNVTPTNLMTVLDNGQFTISSPLLSLAASQSAYIISQSISASNAVGGNYYAVNITPTFFQTTASQTETAFRVAATFTQSSILATGGTNIIADFGATSVGSQLTVTDITSGSIYMVNDVSGLPIIEATSDWTVNMYNFPNIILQKTGSQVNINGTLQVSGSFILPLSQSTTPQTGSAYWSGSLLFIYDGTQYRSSSFA